MHKSLEEFEFTQDPTTDYRVALECLKNQCFHFFSVAIDPFLL